MSTCDVNTILQESVCTPVRGSTQQILLVQAVILCRLLNVIDPMAECDLQLMLNEVQCLHGAHTIQIEYVIAQLLCSISNSLSGNGVSFLCGDGSPEGVQVGLICGQIYTDRLTGDKYSFLGTIGSNTGWV